MDDLSEYKDIYLQTSKEYLQKLNAQLLVLEKDTINKDAIAEIFDSAHSLKSQSAAMGYETTAFLCHTVEDIFFEIKENRMSLTPELADQLFAAFDSLTSSIERIERENTEVDLSVQAEELKKLTGIKTVGGKKTTAQVLKVDNSSGEAAKIKTISVKVDHLDEMMNLMEELLVSRLRLRKLTEEIENRDLRNYYDTTQKIIENLQYKLMQVRTIPLKVVFDHFPRAVRDLARTEGKEIEFRVEGEDLELDRSIVDRLDEPLIHLIRNAVSHGIEKSGTITLSAERERDYALIHVKDDGLGIDWQKLAKKANVVTEDEAVLKKILFSGISTADEVTQVSGRGVGLEVVKKMIENFGGRIDVETQKGKGTTFTLKLPLTLAVTKALLVKVGSQFYTLPALIIDRSLKITMENVKKTADMEVFVLDEREVPLVRLDRKLDLVRDELKIETSVLSVIVFVGSERVALVVDEIVETVEIIVKPVPGVLKNNKAFAGVTILGDGRAALIINPQGLISSEN